MINLYHKIPSSEFAVAVSGGLDSMALLHFVLMGKTKAGRSKEGSVGVKVIHVNHGTHYAPKAEEFVVGWCKKNSIACEVLRLDESEKRVGLSSEEFWRNKRYAWFSKFNCPVMTAHHLNDVAETWLFSCVNGTPSLIPYSHKNVIRPFLLTARKEIENYASSKKIDYVEDPSNSDVSWNRNRIRHNIIPEVLKVNPGYMKVLSKKMKERMLKEAKSNFFSEVISSCYSSENKEEEVLFVDGSKEKKSLYKNKL